MPSAMILKLLGLLVSADVVDPNVLCGATADCKLHEQWPAGTNAAGQQMRVIETRRPAKNAYDNECYEGARVFWLLAEDNAKAKDAVPPRRILRLCNDGYGASGIGEDEVSVSAGLLTHTRYGGSNWRAHTTTEISLDPVAIRSIQTDSTVGTGLGCHRFLDDIAGARRLSWLDPVVIDEDAQSSGCEFERQADALDIPQLESGFSDEAAQARLATQFEQFKAARHTLGNCALEFGTQQLPSAHVLNSRPSETSPVRLRALALDEVHWIIGVHAPKRQPQATRGKWIHEDRLELWLGSFLFTWPEDIEAPVQFGLTLADGQAHRGSGAKGELPVVEHWVAGDWRWYAIDFSPARPDWKVFSATIVYGEGDGRSQGLMLGNSRLKFAKPSTLGGLWTDYTHSCEVRDGALVRTALKPQYADPDHVDPLAATP